MRKPSTFAQLYAWHTAAIAGANPPIHESEPQCGWYSYRFVKGGPRVPARIFIEREINLSTGELEAPEEFKCEINGQPRDPYGAWLWLAKSPINIAAYDNLVHEHATNPMMQATHVKTDLSKEPVRP